MDNDVTLSDLNRKLEILIKLIGYQTVGKMTLIEGAPLLRRLGFTPTEIASIYGSNANAISVRLAEAKKKTKKR